MRSKLLTQISLITLAGAAFALPVPASAGPARAARPVVALAAPNVQAPTSLPLPLWREGVIMLTPSSFQVRDCMWAQAYLEYEEGPPMLASLRVSEGYASVSMAAPLSLPAGAQFTRAEISYFDTDPSSEPSMGIYGIGTSGEIKLVADLSGTKGFETGNNIVTYKLTSATDPAAVAVPAAFEFLVTLSRSKTDVSQQHALYRVELHYRYLP